MKTAQEIASKVQDPADTWEGRKWAKTEPGKAQQAILNALGVQANNFAHAERIFDALGIAVKPVRVGRQSVPEVIVKDLSGGGISIDGDGDAWDLTPDVDLSAIAQWVAK